MNIHCERAHIHKSHTAVSSLNLHKNSESASDSLVGLICVAPV